MWKTEINCAKCDEGNKLDAETYTGGTEQEYGSPTLDKVVRTGLCEARQVSGIGNKHHVLLTQEKLAFLKD